MDVTFYETKWFIIHDTFFHIEKCTRGLGRVAFSAEMSDVVAKKKAKLTGKNDSWKKYSHEKKTHMKVILEKNTPLWSRKPLTHPQLHVPWNDRIHPFFSYFSCEDYLSGARMFFAFFSENIIYIKLVLMMIVGVMWPFEHPPMDPLRIPYRPSFFSDL